MTSETRAGSRFNLNGVTGRGRGWLGRGLGMFRRLWAKRWGKAAIVLLALPILGYLLLWLIFVPSLPSAESLLTYQPALPSNVRDIDGMPVQQFARERRVELAFEEYPPVLVNAFLSAEDKTFFSHGGLDYPALATAVFNYTTSLGSGERVAGARPLPSRWPRTSSLAMNIRSPGR
jgi:penicillin-binding protein 1A